MNDITITYVFEVLMLAAAAAFAWAAHKEAGGLGVGYTLMALFFAWQAGHWAGVRKLFNALGGGA